MKGREAGKAEKMPCAVILLCMSNETFVAKIVMLVGIAYSGAMNVSTPRLVTPQPNATLPLARWVQRFVGQQPTRRCGTSELAGLLVPPTGRA